MGGFGSAVIEYMIDHQFQSNIHRIGLPDRFIEHGTLNELHAECGLDAASILKKIEQIIS
jgi:1-deoxy-D-xylulose-5-phosphate synthase